MFMLITILFNSIDDHHCRRVYRFIRCIKCCFRRWINLSYYFFPMDTLTVELISPEDASSLVATLKDNDLLGLMGV